MKDIDWSLLVNDLQDNNFFSQADLSDMLKVSQQSVSNWQTGARNPSPNAKRKLVEIASKNGIDVSTYRVDPEIMALNRYMNAKKGRELLRIFEQYMRMTQVDKKKFLDYAAKLAG
jgi:hypothetical protein